MQGATTPGLIDLDDPEQCVLCSAVFTAIYPASRVPLPETSVVWVEGEHSHTIVRSWS